MLELVVVGGGGGGHFGGGGVGVQLVMEGAGCEMEEGGF